MTWLQLFGSEYRLIAQDILAFALIISAFIWGGGPERAVAATWLIVFEIGGRVQTAFFGPRQLLDVDIYAATSDLIVGISFIAIALYANRNYTLWIGGMQVLAISAHVARALAEAISPIGYVVMVVAPGWLQLFLLGIGLARHVARKRKYGPYRDWRISRTSPNFKSLSAGGTFSADTLGKVPVSWRDDVK